MSDGEEGGGGGPPLHSNVRCPAMCFGQPEMVFVRMWSFMDAGSRE